jgi:hypothetical protein
MFLLALLLAAPALAQPIMAEPILAQPADCPAVPVGPPVDLQIYVNPPGHPGVLAGIALPPVPMFGTRCIAIQPPPTDVLRGPPAPNGLLQGNGPRDVLHNRYTPEVTVELPLAAPEP